MTDDDNKRLRMMALTHAINLAKQHAYNADTVVDMANRFYNFLKGSENENVQNSDH